MRLALQLQQKRKHKFWFRPIYVNRKEQEFYQNLIAEMRLDNESYFNFFRMLLCTFDALCRIIGPKLEKKKTFF